MKKRIESLFPEWKIALVLGLFFILASLFVDRFFDIENFKAILVQIAPVGVIAVGMTFVILTAGIDLSVGSLVAMISVLMAGGGQYPALAIILLALLLGLGAGAANGLLISTARLSPFIVTLATMAIAKGIALWVSNTEEHIILDPSFAWLGSGSFLWVPIPIWIFGGAVALGQIVLRFTVFGKHVCAVGSNPVAAHNAGVSVENIQLSVYLISGLCSALGALIISARLNVSTPTLGEFYELDAIAAVIIGGTSLFGGRGSVIGTCMGMLIFGIITNVLNLEGTSPHMQRIAKGIIILIAVGMQSRDWITAIKVRLLTPTKEGSV